MSHELTDEDFPEIQENQGLYSKLVPDSGKADTLEGECLRAIHRIIYRYYNDGDYWWNGYGCETAGPAVTFLREQCPVDVKSHLHESDQATGAKYANALRCVLEKIEAHGTRR